MLARVIGDRIPGALAQSSVCQQDSARHAGTQGNWERPPDGLGKREVSLDQGPKGDAEPAKQRAGSEFLAETNG